jgi:hypothetical protein
MEVTEYRKGYVNRSLLFQELHEFKTAFEYRHQHKKSDWHRIIPGTDIFKLIYIKVTCLHLGYLHCS